MNSFLAWMEGKEAIGRAVSTVGEQGSANSRVMPSLKVAFPGMGLDPKQEVNWRFKHGTSNQGDTRVAGGWC